MAAVAEELRTVAADLSQGVGEAFPYAVGFFVMFGFFLLTAPAKRLGLDDPTQHYWASSATSTVHALIVVPLAYYAMEPFWWSEVLTLKTEASSRVNNIFVGYIMADTLPLLWNRNRWSGTTVYIWHHGTAFLCWCLMGVRGHGHAIAVGLILCEATAPFVNGRWFLSILKMKDGPIYYANGAAMAVSFFALRIVWMGWLIVRNLIMLRSEFFALPVSTIALVFFGVVVGYPMQMMWFQKIASGLIKVLRGSSGKSTKDSPAKAKPKASDAAAKPVRAEAFPVGEANGNDKKVR